MENVRYLRVLYSFSFQEETSWNYDFEDLKRNYMKKDTLEIFWKLKCFTVDIGNVPKEYLSANEEKLRRGWADSMFWDEGNWIEASR